MGRVRIVGACIVAFGVAACAEARTEEAPRQLAQVAMSTDTVVVWKSPTCGCCNDWVEHMRANGFPVVTHDTDEMEPIKRRLGVPAGRISCHTATVRGYTIEGHVPADLVRRLIDEKSAFAGLAVPGMPMGSPGMEGPYSQRYDVLAFDRNGNVQVYDRR